MQGVRLNRKRIIIFIVLPIILFISLVGIDQGLKYLFTELNIKQNLRTNEINVIKDFFYFSYTLNSGSAYGFLSNKDWAQTFFKILTVVALIAFFFVYLYAVKKGYKTFTFAVVFFTSGAVGNFIDRLLNGEVVDFICIEVFGNRIFGIFNFADVLITVGMILLIIHFLFLDENAIFKKKNGN